ncbi:putative nuclease HARBI1 isoform X2 [Coccinella septempunctata]|uniref:putative nuclease HARBI1 isoform X2 n=1 Tax=Coccinella septempunctata TaxID=41139 RepID=UPI001D095BFF|nr:putative nuclease HARBI1 isoform X2 [Coccinella septempunctata]
MEYLSSDESDMELLEMIDEFDEESESEENLIQKVYKARVDYMIVLNNYEFTYRFRLSKSAVRELLDLINPYLKVKSPRNHGISPLHQILLALRFYALGTMLVSVADFIGVSIASASRIVNDVSKAIAKLYPRFVSIERHCNEEFYAIAGFPRVRGVIDGTHILIQSPNSNIGEEFRNRKGSFSLNVQVVCDASLRFQNVVARWPGSSHDATIFNHSDLKEYCEQGRLANSWLLGDSAYPCKPYLLTPILNPTTRGEQLYNESHIRTRNTIERCIGVWKRRFPVLALKMRLKLENIQAVIIATSVLHNIARCHNLEEVDAEVHIPNDEMNIDEEIIHSPSSDATERRTLVDSWFSTL